LIAPNKFASLSPADIIMLNRNTSRRNLAIEIAGAAEYPLRTARVFRAVNALGGWHINDKHGSPDEASGQRVDTAEDTVDRR
jgi:hypothetical protein